MPATVHLDTVANSQFFQQGSLKQYMRGFMIEGIDTNVGAAALMVTASKTVGMPQIGEILQADSSLRVIGYQFQGQLSDSVTGSILYSSGTGLTPSTLLITTGTEVVNVQSNMLVDGTPIEVSFDGDTANGIPFIKPDYLTSSYLWPCKTKIIEGLNYGNPNNAAEDFVGWLNEGTFLGKPTGSWMIKSFNSVYSVYQGQSSYRLVIMSAPGRNKFWTTGIMENRQGLKAYYEGQKDDIKAAVAKPYTFGEVAPKGKGFSVHGAYYTISFPSLGINVL